ncbi:GFA family protein [Georgfuchsia toluolica]|uniref:GFA family protein n=1 Tax=Georgfuchsia toluolica TaxID=424218 RepID=UPI001C738CA4|nr:GFA family protein [Georgfuchsia toluolica]
MVIPFTGGCACGLIRYECHAEPLAVAHCYCTDCQKTSGAQASTNVLVPKPAFSVVKGKATCFDTKADSGNTVTRYFCSQCGSNLWSVPNGIPDLLIIKAGTLDDPSGITPGMSIFCDSAQPWAVIPDAIPRFPKMPPM